MRLRTLHDPAHTSPHSFRKRVNGNSTGFLRQLFDRGFNWVVASEAVVDIGMLARVAAQSWVAYDLTSSTLWVGMSSQHFAPSHHS